MFDVMLAPTPPGYGKVTWNQLKRTDEEMFRRISRECRDGLRWGVGENPPFEGAMKRLMNSGCGSGRNKQGGCRCQGDESGALYSIPRISQYPRVL